MILWTETQLWSRWTFERILKNFMYLYVILFTSNNSNSSPACHYEECFYKKLDFWIQTWHALERGQKVFFVINSHFPSSVLRELGFPLLAIGFVMWGWYGWEDRASQRGSYVTMLSTLRRWHIFFVFWLYYNYSFLIFLFAVYYSQGLPFFSYLLLPKGQKINSNTFFNFWSQNGMHTLLAKTLFKLFYEIKYKNYLIWAKESNFLKVTFKKSLKTVVCMLLCWQRYKIPFWMQMQSFSTVFPLYLRKEHRGHHVEGQDLGGSERFEACW